MLPNKIAKLLLMQTRRSFKVMWTIIEHKRKTKLNCKLVNSIPRCIQFFNHFKQNFCEHILISCCPISTHANDWFLLSIPAHSISLFHIFNWIIVEYTQELWCVDEERRNSKSVSMSSLAVLIVGGFSRYSIDGVCFRVGQLIYARKKFSYDHSRTLIPARQISKCDYHS